jgi:threonine/homoserine/homoserine lactone efflux protein
MPFAMGTGLGVGSLLFAVAIGLGAATSASPVINMIMRAVTGLYLLYLAWKIGTSGAIGERAPGIGLGFWSGIGFQWINPKTWASAMAMATTYLPPNPSHQGALAAAGVFCTIAWLTQPAWIGFGGALRRLLSDSRNAALINVGLAALLLASTLPFLLGHG